MEDSGECQRRIIRSGVHLLRVCQGCRSAGHLLQDTRLYRSLRTKPVSTRLSSFDAFSGLMLSGVYDWYHDAPQSQEAHRLYISIGDDACDDAPDALPGTDEPDLRLWNWQTFYKNVVLLLCAIVVFIGYDKLGDLLSRKKEWMVTTWSFIFILGMALYALYYIPVFDFRPYKVGVNIPQAMEIPEDAELSEYDTRFVMEKDGVRKEFGLDDYPDSTWTFIESKTVLLKQGYEPPIHDFSLMSFETGEDMTSDILEHRGYTFLLVVHRVEEADDSDIDLVNEVFDYSVEHGYPFYALTSSPAEEIEAWRENTGAEYEFFLADDIVLKTIIRSNPGLLLLKDGTILNKWSNKSLPDEFALSAPLDQVELGQQKVINNPMRYLIIFFIFIVPLSLLLGQDLIRKQMRKNKN